MSLYFRNTVISFPMDAIPLQADNFSYGPIHHPILGHSYVSVKPNTFLVIRGGLLL